MSALARLLLSRDKNVSGSDSAESKVTDGLVQEGVKINFEQVSENISDDVECVIYTLAIPDDNPELVTAREKGIPTFLYSEMLGKISENMKTIAVSGTHGKTTTTAMISDCLRASEINPYTIVGSLMAESGTNYLEGDTDLFLVEACEYKKSFLNLSPEILVITNIEEDHLDFYKDLEDIQNTFLELAEKTSGKIICNPNDKNLAPVVDMFLDKIVDYTKYIDKVPELNVLGKHNILNSAAALAVSDILDADLDKSKQALSVFKGTWRRLEYKGENENGAILYDDYAHHPSEIKSGLESLKEKFSNKKVSVIFQPHLYSRTKEFFDDFVKVLQIADKVYVLPIYAAREKNNSSINSEMILEKITDGTYLKDFNEAKEIVKVATSEDVVVTMGAGDIDQVI